MSFFLQHRFKASQAGNTLMELILVMVLVAVGAAIAIPNMDKSWDTRKVERAAKSLETIADAIRIYDMENATIYAGAAEGTFQNHILDGAALGSQAAFTALLNRLAAKGFLNQADLTPRFCYTWTNLPIIASATGQLTGTGRIQAAMNTNSGCSTDPAQQAVYIINFNQGRGNDQKIIGNRPAKTRLSNSDNF